MKTKFSALCVAMSVACAVPALADPITFIGSGGDCHCEGDWHEPGSWSPLGTPGATDLAVIPAGKQAIVVQNANPVGAIQIAADLDPDDPQKFTHVRIANGVTLPIAGSQTSVVDGNLHLLSGGTLRIDANLTITGDGQIQLDTGAAIVDNGGGEILTITSSPGCTPLDRSCAIELWSELGGEVKAALHNAAFVVAKRSEFATPDPCLTIVPSLKLTTSAKNGAGFWIAEHKGHLQVSAEVTGSGTWIIEDTACDKIIIDTCCDEVTGNVNLSEGEFIVRSGGYFCTTGDALLESSITGGADVVSYSGRTAVFGAETCACP